MDYKETFAKRLISLREQKNITQQELADELGITRQSLSLYEKAERTINIELLAKIADFFNVSTDYLMGRTDTATLDESIQTACKVTGLNEDAIQTLAESYAENQNETSFLDARNELISSCLIEGIAFECSYIAQNSEIVLSNLEQLTLSDMARYCSFLNISVGELLEHLDNIIHSEETEEEIKEKQNVIKNLEYHKYKVIDYAQEIIKLFDVSRAHTQYRKKELMKYLNITDKTFKDKKESEENG